MVDAHLLFDGVEARIDFRGVDRRAQHPGAQQALAHGREAVIDGTKQGDGVAEPVNSGSTSSRLRTVTASSTRQFWRS